jgi:hypothetical protein
MIADAESVLIFVGPPEGYLDDALQVGQRAAGRQHHPAPDLRTDTSQCNVKPIYDLSFHKRERMPSPRRARSQLRPSAPLCRSLLIQGLAVQAKAGVSRETARRVVRAALLSWPES